MFNNFTETELTHEQWRDIDGYDGAYQVSDLGRVRSHKSGEWKVMRPAKNHNGYLSVNLSKNKEIKHFYVHRLVAQAFIPNDDESKTIINHKNEKPSQNFVNNLEWCDYKYNSTYNDIQYRKKNSKRHKIEKLYDPNLSIKQNIEIFKANGIECSNGVLLRFRKDLNLDRHYYQPKRSKVKGLYDPNLTYAENLEIFKANGIECSEKTVLRLRKDLGLNGSRTKYKQNKVRELYNPDLSYKENLEIFKENGVECSEYIVTQLRKELGLTNNKRDKVKDLYNPELSINENIKVFKENGIECSRGTVIQLRRDLGLINRH